VDKVASVPSLPTPGVLDRLSEGVEGIKHLDYAELHVPIGVGKEKPKEPAEHLTDQWKLLEKVSMSKFASLAQ